jgi:hypothetical protein
MECMAVEKLELSAEDTFRGCVKSKRKNTRLQEPKTVLFAHLHAFLTKIGDTLTNLKVSFR